MDSLQDLQVQRQVDGELDSSRFSLFRHSFAEREGNIFGKWRLYFTMFKVHNTYYLYDWAFELEKHNTLND